MKPFDIELAKQGYPVCTRDGRDVRIVCFDRKDDCYSIVALIDNYGSDDVYCYLGNGRFSVNSHNNINDLFMKSKKHEVWTWGKPYIQDTPFIGRYFSKEEAEQNPVEEAGYVLVKLEWED